MLFVQADLQEIKAIYRIKVTGTSNSAWVYVVTSFTLAYGFDDTAEQYRDVLDVDGLTATFHGNTAVGEIVDHQFYSPIIARYVMLYPKSWNTHIALSWGLFGCTYGRCLRLCLQLRYCTYM